MVRATFARVVELCLERQAQVLIIAGDLFDCRRPAPATVEFVLARLARLRAVTPPVHVFLLPGTHDCWSEHTVYSSVLPRSLPDHIHVLGGPEPPTVHLPHLDLAVHGVAHQCDRGGQQPLRHLAPSTEASLNVGVAHGSIERGDIAGDSSMFAPADIAATGMDYLALGHWHSWHDHSTEKVRAINPGSPEVLGFGQRERGAVAEVTLGEGPSRVERVEVGELEAVAIDVDVGALEGDADLIAQLGKHVAAHRLLDVRLKGLWHPGVVPDLQHIEEELRQGCFAVRLSDESHAAVEDIDEGELSEALVLGRFVRLARERIEQATDDRQRRVAERALQYGLALLRGKGVL